MSSSSKGLYQLHTYIIAINKDNRNDKKKLERLFDYEDITIVTDSEGGLVPPSVQILRLMSVHEESCKSAFGLTIV